jgi:hypothetical protein
LKINQEIVYLINYKPLLESKKSLNNKNLVYCKNFFLFLLLLEELAKNAKYNSSITNKLSKLKLNKKKKTKYLKSFLRAPNKYKKAQIKIELIRYEVKFKFSFMYEVCKPKINKNTPSIHEKGTYKQKYNISLDTGYKSLLCYFINFLFYFSRFFESTLFFLKKKRIIILFDLKGVNILPTFIKMKKRLQ